MQNVTMQVKDGKTVITIDNTKRLGPSKSGKTIGVASTNGNVPIPNTNLILGLNVYTKDGVGASA